MHTHECRRCSSSIECDLPGCEAVGHTTLPVWEGDNVGCPNEIAEHMAEYNRYQAAEKTDSQLANWTATFKSAQPGTPNYPMLQACIAEQEKRNRK